MYKKKNRAKQHQMQFITLDDLVPKNHILRLIDEAIDFSFIYDEVDGLYAAGEKGRPGIDPVALFKIIFIQYLFGIRSMRQTIKEIEVNAAYRWFIGYGLLEPIPHFSTFSKNYARRFSDTDIFEHIFQHILSEAVNSGFVDASAVFIDGTHIKASANKHKREKIRAAKSVPQYKADLDREVDADRQKYGKKPFDRSKEKPAESEKTVSTTDPDSGMFAKGEHERQMAYVANTACDRNSFVLAFHLGAGNIHDSQMFHEVYKKLGSFQPEIESVAVDAGYKTPGIMREIAMSGAVPVVPYKRPMTKEGFFRKHEYVYDEYYDCYICPANKILSYATTNRGGYSEYKSNPHECKGCSFLEKCTASRSTTKIITRHIWSEYAEYAEECRYVPKYKEIYKERKETIERIFADAKERHGLRYATMHGLAKVKMQVTLIFACMNLKKIAIWKHRKLKRPAKNNLKNIFAGIMHIFFNKIKPAAGVDNSLLVLSTVWHDDYRVYIQIQHELSIIADFATSWETDLRELPSEEESESEYHPKELLDKEFQEKIDKLLKDALTECNFPNLTTARLNLSSFDVEINGHKKQNFNGQGYTSFLNSIIAISFRQYLSENAVYDPGFLVIDTPLLGLDQGISDVSPESMRASLYTYFTNHQDCGQIILLDNMKDVPNIDFKSTGTNIITFTKGLEPGRYGFLMDVTD